MINIIGKKWLFFIFSGILIIPGLISLVFWGLQMSIDFTGGTLLELKIETDKSNILDNIKQVATQQNIEISSIQITGNNSYLLRLKQIDQNRSREFQSELSKKTGTVSEVRLETVGPTIGKETQQNAMKAIVVATVAIIVYITAVFRKIPKPYSSIKFGLCAVVALIHDILVVVGIFSIFGHYLKVEVDSLFITALLTVIGFSVHDTIVVFDRIRENLKKIHDQSFEFIVNESILQTLARSLSTSLTVVFTLLALLLFGGETIRWFIVALLIGILSGTYSSIFNAAPLLVVWESLSRKNVKRL